MTLKDFQNEARRRGHFHDNTKAAMAYWSKCWGLGYHDQLWCYKEYTMGNLTYKSGNVVLRHGKYRNTVCLIEGEYVSEFKFKKALESSVAPAVTEKEHQYINECNARVETEVCEKRERCARRSSRRELKSNPAQMVLDFDAA